MAEFPRITYHAAGRTFDRLFKEKSLADTKDVVRSKLGIGADVGLALAQLRDNRRIDLDDDGDFEAFKAVLRSTSHVNVVVSVEGEASPNQNGAAAAFDAALAPHVSIPSSEYQLSRDLPSLDQTSKKKSKKRQNSVSSVASAVPARLRTPGSESRPSDTESEESEPRRKKRKVAFDGTTVVPLRIEAAPVASASRDVNIRAKAPVSKKESKKTKDVEPAKQPTVHEGADAPIAKVTKHKQKKLQNESIPDVTPEPPTTVASRPASAGIPIAIPGQPLPPPPPAHIPQRPAPPANSSPAPDAQPAERERKRKRKRTATPDLSEPAAPSKKTSKDADLKKKKKPEKRATEATLDSSLPAPVASSPLETPPRPLKKAKRTKDKDSVSGEAGTSARDDEKKKKVKEERKKEKEQKKKEKEKKSSSKGVTVDSEDGAPVSGPVPSRSAVAENVAEVNKAEKHPMSKAVEAAVKAIGESAPVANRNPIAASADADRNLEKAKAKRRKSQAPSAKQNGAQKDTETPAPTAALADVEATPAKAKRRKSTVPEAEIAAPTASTAAKDADSRLDLAPGTRKYVAEPAKATKSGRKSKAAEVPAAEDVNPEPAREALNGDAQPVKAKKAGRKSSAVETEKSRHEAPVSATAPSDEQEDDAEPKSKAKPRKSSAASTKPPKAPLPESDLTPSELSEFQKELRTIATAVIAKSISNSRISSSSSAKKAGSSQLTPIPAPPSTPASAPTPPAEAPKASALKKRSTLAESSDVSDAGTHEEVTAPKPTSPEKPAEKPSTQGAAHTPRRLSAPRPLNISPVVNGMSLGSVLRPSTPTLPVGTTISEVTIQGQDEGSSNDSSDEDDEDEDEDEEDKAAEDVQEGHAPPQLTQPSSTPIGLSIPQLSHIATGAIIEDELEAIIAGPQRSGPRRSVLDEIPVDSNTNTEDESEPEDSPPVDEDEDEDEQKAARQRSKAVVRERSSSAEAADSDNEIALDDSAMRASPLVYMDGSQEVPPPEPVGRPVHMEGSSFDFDLQSPSPSELEDTQYEDEVEEQLPGQPIHVSQEGDEPSDKATSEDSAPTVVEGDISEKSPAPQPTPVTAPEPILPDEGEKEADTGGDQRRSASPESDTTIKGIESPDEQPSPKQQTADDVPPPDAVDVSAHVEDNVDVPPKPNSQMAATAGTEAQEDAPVEPPAASSQTDRSTPQPSIQKDDELESIEPADDFGRQTPVQDVEDDPIEMDPSQRRASPVRTTPKPGTVRRMKGRNGKPMGEGAGPSVLASQASEGGDSVGGGPVT
ncbi:hypothetical protein EVG20_g7077, partial [Dentipellis fragilis]